MVFDVKNPWSIWPTLKGTKGGTKGKLKENAGGMEGLFESGLVFYIVWRTFNFVMSPSQDL